MGKNEVKKNGLRKGDKQKIAPVAKISYTPQTLAAAIARNIRFEQATERDLSNMHWNQGHWGDLDLKTLMSDEDRIEIKILDGPAEIEGCTCSQCLDIREETPSFTEFVGVSCPTTGCIAGWATALSGDVMVVRKSFVDSFVEDEYYMDRLRENEILRVTTSDIWNHETGQIQSITARAQELLGADYDEKNYLFSEQRTLAEVLNVLDTVATGGKISESSSYIHYVVEDHDDCKANYDDDGHRDGYDYPNFKDDCEWCKLMKASDTDEDLAPEHTRHRDEEIPGQTV